MASLEELQILRKTFPENEEFHFSVYPGHPVTVAYLITQIFPTYEEAFDTPEGVTYGGAIGSCKIPGAGGNVYEALDLLSRLRDGMPWSLAIKYANDSWFSCDSQGSGGYVYGMEGKQETEEEQNKREIRYKARWKKGQQQADKLQVRLAKQSDWWELPAE